jgi:quercetin dioxygenase-like cupin family protein
MTYRGLLVAGVALSAITLAAMPASAKELKNIGMSVGSMSNPYFIALAEGATNAAKKINPDAKLTVVSSEYDLGKQFSQMDNFIAAGVDLILVAADDPHAIAPAVKRAQDAGIPVIAVDVEAEGANATIETDNYQAGLVSCAYLGEKMGGAGDVVMQWVGPLSGSIARIKGCHDALGKHLSRLSRAEITMPRLRILGTTLVLAFSVQLMPDAQAAPPQPVVAPVMQKDLADVPGKEMVMLTVEYPPGTVEHVHRHDAYAFVYVLEGTIVEQVRGGKEVTLTPGQTFYEGPDDVHTVGRNASATKPAKFLVVMLKKKGVDAVLPAE